MNCSRIGRLPNITGGNFPNKGPTNFPTIQTSRKKVGPSPKCHGNPYFRDGPGHIPDLDGVMRAARIPSRFDAVLNELAACCSLMKKTFEGLGTLLIHDEGSLAREEGLKRLATKYEEDNNNLKTVAIAKNGSTLDISRLASLYNQSASREYGQTRGFREHLHGSDDVKDLMYRLQADAAALDKVLRRDFPVILESRYPNQRTNLELPRKLPVRDKANKRFFGLLDDLRSIISPAIRLPIIRPATKRVSPP